MNMQSRKNNVLLVEDDTALMRSITFTLRRHNYQVFNASDSDSACAVLSERRAAGDPIDVIMADIQLVVVSGQEIFDRIIAIEPEVPILVITGDESQSLMRLLHAKGVQDIMQKPFTGEELMLKVAAILAKQREIDNSH